MNKLIFLYHPFQLLNKLVTEKSNIGRFVHSVRYEN